MEKKEEEEMVVGGKGCCRSCDRLREKRRKSCARVHLLRRHSELQNHATKVVAQAAETIGEPRAHAGPAG